MGQGNVEGFCGAGSQSQDVGMEEFTKLAKMGCSKIRETEMGKLFFSKLISLPVCPISRIRK